MKQLSLILLLGISCSTNTAPVNQALSPTADVVEGVRWNLQDLPGMPPELPEIARAVFIRLDSGKVSGFAGCNSIFGSYAIQGDTLRFNPVGSTKKYCNTGMEIETRLVEGLTLTNRYRYAEDRLRLYRDDSLLVSFVAAAQQ